MKKYKDLREEKEESKHDVKKVSKEEVITKDGTSRSKQSA